MVDRGTLNELLPDKLTGGGRDGSARAVPRPLGDRKLAALKSGRNVPRGQKRVRKDQGAENKGCVRRLAMNLMKKTEATTGKKMSVRGKRTKCGRDPKYMLKVKFNAA